jgi:hypothetical protein
MCKGQAFTALTELLKSVGVKKMVLSIVEGEIFIVQVFLVLADLRGTWCMVQ